MTPVEGDPARGAPLDSSSHSWMPFLGSFAPAGYEPAAAPDPLAWSMSWPMGMGYSPYMTAMTVGGGSGGQPPLGHHYLPVIGGTALAAQEPLTPGEITAAVEADASERPSAAAERNELDLDALAQLEQAQSNLLLQSHVAADTDLVGTSSSTGEEPFTAATVTATAPNGSSPPFDLFALLRSPSPVHPFATAGASVNAGPAGIPFAFDPWGPAAVTSPIKLHPSNSVSQQLSASPGTSNERGRQLQVGAKSLPATVGHAASFLASSDWAFTQAYLLSHCEQYSHPVCAKSSIANVCALCRYFVSRPPRFDRVFASRE